MATKARFDETAFQWEHIDRVAPRFKRHLRPILQGVEFAAPSTDDPLIEAVHFLKATFPKGKPLGHYAETAIPTRLSDAKLFANRSALFANDAESAMIAFEPTSPG